MLYRTVLRPLLFRLPPEKAHEIALNTLSLALRARPLRTLIARRYSADSVGEVERFGLRFKNPVGLAAGFDKNGKIVSEVASLGFGFVEVGTVTHLPQPGNPQPRLFRLPNDSALINRQGFNNEGAATLVRRLAQRDPHFVVGINIGKSRVIDIAEATNDYLSSFRLVQPLADYVAVNVSSPNTPGLRELQKADRLVELLGSLQRTNAELSSNASRPLVPLLVKISPDLSTAELEMIVDVANRTGIVGIIATNTTVARTGLKTSAREVANLGDGGLSGPPLRHRSTKIVAELSRMTRGSIAIIGVGGVFTAEDAWEKICAGASLVQLYTGFIYKGLSVARDINEGLKVILDREGFRNLDEAVGCRAEEFAR